ncbi:hypothetical protein [Prescottella equi]|nr:hypothetical protein [Prescottella equi]
MASTDRLVETDNDASIKATSSFDNGLFETIDRLCKIELMKATGRSEC